MTIKGIIGRIHDWRRERRIDALSTRCAHASSSDELRDAWNELVIEINSRSLAQVERMEKRMGLV